MCSYLQRLSSVRAWRRAARARLLLPPILAIRLAESDLQTTSIGPVVRTFGTFPRLWSGKYAGRSAWPKAEAGIRIAPASRASGSVNQRTPQPYWDMRRSGKRGLCGGDAG